MKHLTSRLRVSAVIIGVLCIQAVMAPRVVVAHTSPPGCNSNRLNVDITKNKTEVQQGDTLVYSVNVANLDAGSALACDFTNVTIDVTLPAADGTPTGTVVNVVTNASYTASMPVTSVGTVPYIVNVNAGVTDIVAQVSASGTLHDAPVDHSATITRTVGTSVIVPAPSNSGSGAGTTTSEGAAASSGSSLPALPKTGRPPQG